MNDEGTVTLKAKPKGNSIVSVLWMALCVTFALLGGWMCGREYQAKYPNSSPWKPSMTSESTPKNQSKDTIASANERAMQLRLNSLEQTVSLNELLNKDARDRLDNVEALVTKCDPNDPVYKYLPPPPAKWLERFGDTERSRLLYGISAVRVQQEMQSQALAKIQRTLAGSEPNEVKR